MKSDEQRPLSDYHTQVYFVQCQSSTALYAAALRRPEPNSDRVAGHDVAHCQRSRACYESMLDELTRHPAPTTAAKQEAVPVMAMEQKLQLGTSGPQSLGPRLVTGFGRLGDKRHGTHNPASCKDVYTRVQWLQSDK